MGTTPTSHELPLLEFSATDILQSNSGYETETCGDLTYTKFSDQSWITLDSSNQLLFHIAANQDTDLRGSYDVIVEITSVDYPNILPHTIFFEIDVVCSDAQLIATWTPPPVWVPQSLDESMTWDTPTYESCLQPVPITDLEFEFYDSSGQSLSWITADLTANQFTAQLTKAVFE